MPVLARVYHIPPREQARLTLQQFNDLRADYDALLRSQEEG